MHEVREGSPMIAVPDGLGRDSQTGFEVWNTISIVYW